MGNQVLRGKVTGNMGFDKTIQELKKIWTC